MQIILVVIEGVHKTQRVYDYFVREWKKVELELNCSKTEIIKMNIVNSEDAQFRKNVAKKIEMLKYLATVLIINGSLRIEFEESLKRAYPSLEMFKVISNSNNF